MEPIINNVGIRLSAQCLAPPQALRHCNTPLSPSSQNSSLKSFPSVPWGLFLRNVRQLCGFFTFCLLGREGKTPRANSEMLQVFQNLHFQAPFTKEHVSTCLTGGITLSVPRLLLNNSTRSCSFEKTEWLANVLPNRAPKLCFTPYPSSASDPHDADFTQFTWIF